MGKLIALEMKKIFSRKEVMIILAVLILAPVFLAFCMVNKVAGINFGGAVSAEAFGILMWTFLKYLFLIYLVPIYIAISFLGKEIENRSINLMLSNQKRWKTLAAKTGTYAMVLTGFFILFQLSSLGSYYIFVDGTEYSMAMEASAMEIMFSYLFQWLELLFVLLLAVLLCCVLKGNAALLMGLVIVICQRLLVNIDGIKRILPYYISDYNYSSMIPKEQLFGTNMVSFGIYAVILFVLAAGAANIWRNRDF